MEKLFSIRPKAFEDFKKILNNLNYRKDDVFTFKLFPKPKIYVGINKVVELPDEIINIFNENKAKDININFVNAAEIFKKAYTIFDGLSEVYFINAAAESYKIKGKNIELSIPKLIISEDDISTYTDFEELIKEQKYTLVYKNEFTNDMFSKLMNLSKSDDVVKFIFDLNNSEILEIKTNDLTLILSDDAPRQEEEPNTIVELEFPQLLGIKYPKGNITLEIYNKDFDYIARITFTTEEYKTNFVYTVNIYDFTNTTSQGEDII